MSLKTFSLSATVSSENVDGVRGAAQAVLGSKARVERTEAGLTIEATVVGVEARELNRQLLSAMRKIEKGARLRSRWTVDGVTERFLDYVFLKDKDRG